MADQFEIQQEDSYTQAERDFCKFLSDICGYKVLLGFGEKSWADVRQGIIVIDKREHARPLIVATVQNNYESALLLLSSALSHLMAHIKTGIETEDHGVDFYQEQISCLIIVMGGIVKHPPKKKAKGKKMKGFKKIVYIRGEKTKKMVIDSISKMPVEVKNSSDNMIEITADTLEWGDYIKLTRTLKQWSDTFPLDVKVERAQNE